MRARVHALLVATLLSVPAASLACSDINLPPPNIQKKIDAELVSRARKAKSVIAVETVELAKWSDKTLSRVRVFRSFKGDVPVGALFPFKVNPGSTCGFGVAEKGMIGLIILDKGRASARPHISDFDLLFGRDLGVLESARIIRLPL